MCRLDWPNVVEIFCPGKKIWTLLLGFPVDFCSSIDSFQLPNYYQVIWYVFLMYFFLNVNTAFKFHLSGVFLLMELIVSLQEFLHKISYEDIVLEKTRSTSVATSEFIWRILLFWKSHHFRIDFCIGLVRRGRNILSSQKIILESILS